MTGVPRIRVAGRGWDVEDAERRRRVDRWFRAHAGPVRSYLMHRADAETAEDLLQEVFVVAFRKAAVVPDPPLGWLFATARRLLANRRRGLRRHDQLLARVADDLAETVDAGTVLLKQAFLDTLAGLSEIDRDVLTLTGWYGLTPAEAAESLGCTSTALNVRLHRARRRLAAHLESAGYRSTSPAGLLSEALHD